LVAESRAISKSRNTHEYSIKIPFNSFNEISNFKGSTYISRTDEKETLSSSAISTFDDEHANIYKSDSKYKFFVLPRVEDYSIIEFSYKDKTRTPQFLSAFFFQNRLKTEMARFQV
jgi:hypothetical protein